MKFTTINIQGNIFTSEILDRIRQDNISYQKPQDFGLKPNELVRDEISNAWSLINTHWQIFKQKRNAFQANDNGVTETRRYWILPLLNQLGYEVALSNAEIINGKSYAISHRASNKDGFPIHIVGSEQSLDRKAESGPRLSPHALIQEYINSTEHIYGFVTNGIHFRVLRDATRLSRLSYLEFNLEQMVEEGHYAEFAIFYRLLHASRLKETKEEAKDAIIEFYHNEALASGSRIRERLSQAVERSILTLANGLLKQSENQELQHALENNTLNAKQYYLHILRSVYRVLFLLVIEERNLIYKENLTDEEKKLKDIYYKFYSIQRLTYLVNKAVYIDPKKTDLWQSLLMTFRLFEDANTGKALGIDALGSGIFSNNAIQSLDNTVLNNKSVLEVFKYLVTFENENKQTIRVNYADLDVEEFGSVYEGLLEFEPVVENGEFRFKQGDDRSSSGSHYTPEELVKPLIVHSLDYIIADKLKEADPEQALLSITVCDVACGSGHILLSAARRIGFELARVRRKEDQPTPSALRIAVRDVIKNCIYGVDLNPLAVELCKVALWLEAHEPGQPLNFLDHHIKNGNAIVGLAHFEELESGIASEAFKTLPGDDKEIATAFKKRNDLERKTKDQLSTYNVTNVDDDLKGIQKDFITFSQLPENTPEQIAKKEKAYHDLTQGKKWFRLKQIADLQVAQFFIPKTEDNKEKLTTHSQYMSYLKTEAQIIDRGAAMGISSDKHFFHWFLEFPQVFQNGGFDCILGNPPFLGGQKLSGNYGTDFLEFLKYYYQPIGAVDLVTYFFRRIFDVIKINGFQSLISTNTIAQGSAREGGLDFICSNNGIINHAIRSMKWPGQAAVEVSLITIHKGEWKNNFTLDNKFVERITSYLDDSEVIGKPMPLLSNKGKSFQGSIVLGKGFILTTEEAENLIKKDPRNKDVIFPYLNGDDLNNDSEQKPSRWVINFFDWDEEKAKTYPDCFDIVERLVKPERLIQKDKGGKEKWWQFLRPRNELYATISELDQVMVLNRHAKHLLISICKIDIVFSEATVVFALNSFSEFSILTSSIHDVWAWKNSSTMGTSTLRYSGTNAFETFPFKSISSDLLNSLGSKLHQTRLKIMEKYNLGLTELQNKFHDININKEAEIFDDIKKLRELYIAVDNEVIKLYKWTDLILKHDFYELGHLPENDRLRFTIHPKTRKEILKRLLIINLQQYAEESKAIMNYTKTNKKLQKVSSVKTSSSILFPED
ncbi:Eco57I restriction-modification methylase domain-containing protein [Flavobacterium ajazii]|uniref:Eco57I restriction-modification methylase domain-containing protein n=1 Tax=Flavobacterium ajazii TaxID=2692318 RepID=UPI0016525DFF|nr:DNA methyltransferase [Flavobacterium ajazii]